MWCEVRSLSSLSCELKVFRPLGIFTETIQVVQLCLKISLHHLFFREQNGGGLFEVAAN